MCLSRPHFTMIFCHSEIGRPHFFSIDGKYEAGPCLDQGAENSGTSKSPPSGFRAESTPFESCATKYLV